MTASTLAEQFFERLGAGDVTGALALTANDFTWTVAGKPGQFALAGSYDRASYTAMLTRVAASLPGGPAVNIRSVTADNSRAVIEAHVTGENDRGAAYVNDLIYVFDVEHERISAVREYLDTIHAQEIFAD